eukprot:TRINITY_DN4244_c0_g1_i11.p1 TRINITY_DN4244_c0_g1~~TRINITY_DN4244_c0_g1_i11.p1  ORF type:complete len:349 (+),score=41.90 TRINITY_DN4244_c0_g1_i11:150-1196(+)
MTMSVKAISNNNLPLKVYVAAGHKQYCQIYSITLGRERHVSESSGLRHRSMNGAPPNTNLQPNSHNQERKIVFHVEPLKQVQIDFSPKEPWGKVVRISPNCKLLASGGDDSNVRIWSFPDLSKVHEFTTHDKEIDDIDFSPDSLKVASISKDRRAIIWDIKKGKKHAELGWEPANNLKYMYKRIKFGCVEGDCKKYKVYTISNPIGSSKAKAYLHKWNSQSYTVENFVASQQGIVFSALAVSDNGNFVATGTMMEGIVEIFASFNLSLLRRVTNSHSTFITGLEFLPTSEESAPCRGFSDASVVSISVDHQVCIHHVPRLNTISSFWALLLIVAVLFATFTLCSYLGL